MTSSPTRRSSWRSGEGNEDPGEPRVEGSRPNNCGKKPDTKSSQSTTISSFKMLALKVNFGALEEVKMLASILKCFPNVAPCASRTKVAPQKWRCRTKETCIKSYYGLKSKRTVCEVLLVSMEARKEPTEEQLAVGSSCLPCQCFLRLAVQAYRPLFMDSYTELLLSMCERLLHFALVMWLTDHCYDELIKSLFWNKD